MLVVYVRSMDTMLRYNFLLYLYLLSNKNNQRRVLCSFECRADLRKKPTMMCTQMYTHGSKRVK